MKYRDSMVEGRFYPSGKEQIHEMIRDLESGDRYPDPDLDVRSIFGAILPHAGHLYSGAQSLPFFKMIRKAQRLPDTFVIIHPNHQGQGTDQALDDADAWRNSLGVVDLDRELALATGLPFDGVAHAGEHSAEVLIPFLQYYVPGGRPSILPICMKEQRHEPAMDLASRIHQAATHLDRKVWVLASCDFSHFLAPEEGKAQDQRVLDEILARRPLGVEEQVRSHNISLCGYGPVMTLMHYAVLQDPLYQVRILARGHSGEVHPSDQVVQYISMLFYQ